MNKQMKCLLWLVMLCACILMAVLFINYRGLSGQLKENESLLAKSRESWETTAEEKEKLQEDLKELKNQLKEAELTLQEATERSASLKEEIDELNREISGLQDQVSVND